MCRKHYLSAGLLTLSTFSYAHASETEDTAFTDFPNSAVEAIEPTQTNTRIRDLKNLRSQDLKVDASAAQPDDVKDPLQPLNRKVYAFNDTVDRILVRPVAVQYSNKVPEDVRDSYHSFRMNLNEPWNAVNQVIQGKPVRALKTLGRFTLNTVTSLGFADPASRLNMPSEDESFGTTLGYYGISSGPYLVLPFFGPSTFRDGFGLAVDSIGRPQNYLNDSGLYWTDQTLRLIDVRTQLLKYDDVLQGDKYAQLRDIYLQRKAFQIAEKRGTAEDNLFEDDIPDDLGDE
jgi:phospholipid-binding lipoprotein MlaA